jgi:NTP pyrophosphatase (non-canonical NTP hydrolase)
MKEKEAFELLQVVIRYAKSKHPEFPESPEEGFSIICEEMLELCRAINDEESNDRMIEEALHVAVTAIRFVETRLK